MKHALHRAALVLAVGVLGCATGFSDKDISNLKQAVRDEFTKQPGVSVTEVNFIKESDKKLAGFVKLKLAGAEVVKSCNATMGEGAQYIWKCE